MDAVAVAEGAGPVAAAIRSEVLETVSEWRYQ
ncbi:Uncharacterised protein [Mycobacteroides abscessus subsp. abscessus]|nr:Uncharacterised protein [Mycobacteroides abscessus subsp. abscessus]SIC88330.1 Uncharacterised protein [Mycobacteroides abscessus subsp. abscessus]SID08754.1 Uncharacterised protein [Mycobacteroides abscessus subsp. abscessus]SID41797.1 Uncharacterised protein [Mycobacteroides abscessus subsp. abscessus]SKW01373.1 Uncharacterised protein [Mycobacteroides abscessus subsp. abscessus]